MSMSLWKIKGDAILDSIKAFFKSDLRRNTKLQIGKLGFTREFTLESKTIEEKDDEVEDESVDKIKIGQQVFVRLAEFLFHQKTTLLPIIHSRVFDKVLDGKEYQLIKYRHFYQQLKNSGFNLTLQEKKSVEHVVPSFVENVMELKFVLNLLSKLGINEPFPKSTRHLDYQNMSGQTIRLVNRIIKAMESD